MFTAILVAVVGLISTVLGAVVTSVGASRNERERRASTREAQLTDRRLEAVHDYLLRGTSYTDTVHAYLYMNDDQAAEPETVKALHAAAEQAWNTRMSGASDQLRLLGPKPLAEAVIRYGKALSSYGDLIDTWQPSAEPDEKLDKAITQQWDRVVRAKAALVDQFSA